ncbi:hypothetical protein [Coxiella endosymbiont of Ornithodoros maritimus]|uniref:hypothetical protein n=1 Tax=Coxiella endosymbiont of Ornithodoros maritimus TaxID=1656172 RepID=UPI0022651497|nr:hypothetical protein [Coxiella endosymbiont of Ornithodoros maritimus]
MKTYEVAITKQAERQLQTLPAYIVLKWIDFVKHTGFTEVQKLSGFYDEPLIRKKARLTFNQIE